MTIDTSPLHDTNFLSAILDLLIPPRPGTQLPGAGGLGLAETVATKLAADPRSGPIVEAGLAAVRDAAKAQDADGFLALPKDDRLQIFQDQLVQYPALAPALTHRLYLAYYQHPHVLAALNQPARPPFPEGYEIEQTDPELIALLESRRQASSDA